jgi:ABC-type polysaccharide/polyol phosphate export permease
VYYGQLPKASSIIASFVCAFVSLIIGYSLFQKYQNNFVFYV